MPAPVGSEKEELAVTLAALALYDDNLPITADKINALLESANVSVQKFWPNLFAKTLSSRSHSEIGELILGSGGSGGAAVSSAVSSSSAGSASAAPAAEEKKEDKKAAAKDDSEESEGDMGFGLFD